MSDLVCSAVFLCGCPCLISFDTTLQIDLRNRSSAMIEHEGMIDEERVRERCSTGSISVSYNSSGALPIFIMYVCYLLSTLPTSAWPSDRSRP